jgi:hypothetical protein
MTWGISPALLLGAAVIAWPLLRCRTERRRLEKCIAAVGNDQLRNVLLEDGMGGQSFYEYLLLTPGGILSLVSNPRDGIIFGGERMDTWAQVLGKRTTRFANPFYGMEAQMTTLRHHLPKVVVEGIVLFMGNCSFPKGKPQGVWTRTDLAQAGENGGMQAVVPVLKEAWQLLEQRTRRIDPDSEGYLLPLEQRPSRLRGLLALALAGIALAWPLWRLI